MNKKYLYTLHHLYIYHTFIDTLKIIKFRTPVSIFSLFTSSPSENNFKLLIPKVRLDLAKNNYIFQASCIWNELIPVMLNKCLPNKDGLMVPGSEIDSDLTISIGVVKKKLRVVLLNAQEIDPLKDLLGWANSQKWFPENFFVTHYPA